MSDPFVLRFDPPLPSPTPEGPLADLTLSVKDLFDLAGTPTLCGIRAWPDSAPKAETATLVRMLMDLGVNVIGKTVTEQIAHSTIGINPDYGAPTNAVDASRVPGGSSSGAGSAVAQGLCDVGLGSDTGGSVRIPAAYQHLWGMRPSLGTLPLEGAMELAPSFDTPGFMTRDLATLTRVHQALTPGPARALSILVPREVWAGYNLPVPLDAPTVELGWDAEMAARFSHAFRCAQALEVTARWGQLADRDDLNIHPMILARLTWNKTVSEADRAAAYTRIHDDLARFRDILGDDTALVWPTVVELAPKLDEAEAWGEAHRARQFALTSPAGLLGAPQLHVPSGALGFSLLGGVGSDLDLLETAKALI